MATPTVYKWTDPGAPQVRRGQTSEYQALFQAVFIDGYGTKTPPVSGANKWTMPFTAANGFVMKQGGTASRKTCFKLYDFNSSGHWCKFQAAVDYTDFNTPIGVFSGGSQYNSAPLGYSNNANYYIPWIIIATERAMYVQFGYNNEGTNTSTFDTLRSSQQTSNYHWFFGDYVPEVPSLTVNQCCSFADTSNRTNQYLCDSITYSNHTGYGIKKCAGNAGNISGEFDCIPMYTRAINDTSISVGSRRSDGNDPQYPNMLNGGLYLEKVKFISGRNIMGHFPGLLFPIQDRPFVSTGNIYEIDGSGDYAGNKIHVFTTYNGQYMIHDGDWGIE